MNAPAGTLALQVDRMERARQARQRRLAFTDTHITLNHGSGGKASWSLIDGVLRPAFANVWLDALGEAAVVPSPGETLAFTTDAYVVSPLFFPGGDIGRLAVHGTINDLAMAGARPLYLTVSLILEEGLEIATLRRIVDSIAAACADAGVAVVAGDTKVVERGKADQLFVVTSGVGAVRPGPALHPSRVEPGDAVLLSGEIGNHGVSVLLARQRLELETAITSDTAALHTLADALLDAAPGARCLKDPTRGGVATSLNEIALQSGTGITIEETRIPVAEGVRAACELLGIDPLHLANEGKLLAVVPSDEADAALAALQAHPLGRAAQQIGRITAEPEGMVLLQTATGGRRVLDMLIGDPLPRIC